MLMVMVMVTTVLETMRMTVQQSAELRANSVGLVAQTPTVMGTPTPPQVTPLPKERTHS
jgi:hypothetical protein